MDLPAGEANRERPAPSAGTDEILLPCPFCGDSQSVVSCYQDGFGYWAVGCGQCGSHSGQRPPSDPNGRSKVIWLWNQRPDSKSQWMPIETAPRDGTEILLCEYGGNGYRRIEHGNWGWIDDSDYTPGGGYHGWLSDTGDIEEPTHWMPAIAAPLVPAESAPCS